MNDVQRKKQVDRFMTTVVIRAHYGSAETLRMASWLSDGGYRVVFAADFSSGRFDTGPNDVVEVSVDKVEKLGLFTKLRRSLWQCGDYVLYLAAEEGIGGDVLLTEGDVRFSTDQDPNYFFEGLPSQGDCFLVNFTAANAHWPWYKACHGFGMTVFRCRFPLVFAKSPVIEAAYRQRCEQSAAMPDAMLTDNTLWPNDEAFFASAAVAAGFSVRDFNSIQPMYNSYTFKFDPPFLEEEFVEATEKDDKIYHPVLSFEHYMAKLMRNPAFAHDRTKVLSEIERLLAKGFPEEKIRKILRLPSQ
jgi:hypothetical protein